MAAQAAPVVYCTVYPCTLVPAFENADCPCRSLSRMKCNPEDPKNLLLLLGVAVDAEMRTRRYIQDKFNSDVEYARHHLERLWPSDAAQLSRAPSSRSVLLYCTSSLAIADFVLLPSRSAEWEKEGRKNTGPREPPPGSIMPSMEASGDPALGHRTIML